MTDHSRGGFATNHDPFRNSCGGDLLHNHTLRFGLGTFSTTHQFSHSKCLTFSLMIAVAAPAFAGTTPKTQAACEKHHMKWDATTKTCAKGM